MDPHATFGFKELLTHAVSDMASAMCERGGESQQQKFNRVQAATQMIMAFMPRDTIEMMLAGHCVMFHEAMTAGIRDSLRGGTDGFRRAARPNIVALNRCFGDSLERLECCQKRQSQGRQDEPRTLPVDTWANKADSGPPPMPMPAAPAISRPVATPAVGADEAASFQSSPEAIAACMANPAAMAALEAGDAGAFARAMGVEEPSEEFLAAAADRPDLFPRQALERAARVEGKDGGDGKDVRPVVGTAGDGGGDVVANDGRSSVGKSGTG